MNWKFWESKSTPDDCMFKSIVDPTDDRFHIIYVYKNRKYSHKLKLMVFSEKFIERLQQIEE
jgi:hypothetical protein